MSQDAAQRMAEANMRLMRASNTAYNAGALDRFMESIAPDVEVFPDASIPEAEPLRGCDEYRRWLEGIGSAWTRVRWQIVEQFAVGGDRVVQRGEFGGVGTASGIRTTSSLTGVFTAREGKVTRAEFYFDHRQALKAAGLEESAMAEEPTTPDLVEHWRRAADALGRSDLDAGLSCFAPDAVWELRPLAISFAGIAAIRSFVEDWIGNYDEYHQELVEGHDLGNDVVFALNRQDARLAGTTSRVQELWSFTIMWRAGMIDRVIGRKDIDEARAAAERLAQERG